MSDTPNPNVQPSYAPEIRQLAYAMETMSFIEKCTAIANMADEQHTIGLKNGRVGYVRKSLIAAETNKAVITELNEARKWSTKADTADQVWQQLTDRIDELKKAQQARGNTDV